MAGRGRDPARRDAIWARAVELLEVTPLEGVDAPMMRAGATAVERAAAWRERERTMLKARDSGDPERLATALNWLARYKRHRPGVV